jgi:hypothetical protein
MGAIKQMEEIKLWKIACGASDKPKAAPLEAIAETTTEQLLEEAITTSPELLMLGLTLVGRQTETPGGPLDLLGVDEDGRLVVFELKRGKLTRDAVAQAVDYASYLADLETEELCDHINKSPGKIGSEAIAEFGQWYQNEFQRPVAQIGRPRIVLVGLGVDERAKRMVAFLAQCELDISLLTFYGFKQGGEILLARQVEVQPQQPEKAVKSTKGANQAKFDKLLAGLGIEKTYQALVAAVKQGLGASVYQWPNPTGYSFYLPEVSDAGGPTNRSYMALYTPEQQKGKIQIFLQARAIAAAGQEIVKEVGKTLGSEFLLKNGYGEIWIDGHKSPLGYGESLTALSKAIAAGWNAKKENHAKAEVDEVNANT